MAVSKYQAYLEYKDSGVEWLGDVPEHWKSIQVKYIASSVSTGGTPKELSSFTENSEVCWFSPSDFHKGKILEQANKYVTWKSVSSKDSKIYKENSVLVIGIGATLGKVAYCSKPFSCNQQINVITPNRNINGFFLMYSLIVQREQMIQNSNASTIGIMNQEKTKELFIALPTTPEQTLIANFLDHETAKIDTLIDKQQQLIKLLKEKRQAVISHAVTKGLNPQAPMKDSGVEWLGEVPEHWAVAQLKFNTVSMQTGPFGSQLHAEDYIEGGVPLVNPAHMANGSIIPDSQVTVDLDTQNRLSRHKLSQGEIIFARRGELGRCAIVKNEQVGWLCGTGSLKARLNSRLVSEYAYLLITSKGVISELSLESKGSTMDNLNTETLGRVRLPVPPVFEQNEILIYVDNISGKYKLLIENAESAITLMQERRTALISAAVTGKIDVRDW